MGLRINGRAVPRIGSSFLNGLHSAVGGQLFARGIPVVRPLYQICDNGDYLVDFPDPLVRGIALPGEILSRRYKDMVKNTPTSE